MVRDTQPQVHRSLWSEVRGRISRIAGSSPARAALLIFALAIAVFSSLLMMPWATASGRPASLPDAVFVATSAVSVTGLTPVNTAEHWSLAGQIVIIVAIQLGGLGILTVASVLAASVSRSLGVRTKLVAQEGWKTDRLGEVAGLIKIVITISLVVEALLALILISRLIAIEGDVVAGIWHGLFYAISSFNNAGFVIHPGGLADIGYDPVAVWTIMIGVFLGSLGFPVLYVLWRFRWHFNSWTLHAKLTMEVTLLLMIAGAAIYGFMEWHNEATIGDRPFWEKLQSSLFASVNMRSGGFSVVTSNDENSTTMLVSNALMFAGGGSASTAGGIKVTTIAVIFLAFMAEARGDAESTSHHRTIPASAVRVAVSVVAMGATLVLISTLALMHITGLDMERPLYESISAFATAGLTSGLTEELPPSGLYVLAALMFAGRVGIITFAAALAVRHRSTRYRYPEGRPILG